jgi:lipid-A-disaccharide synthase
MNKLEHNEDDIHTSLVTGHSSLMIVSGEASGDKHGAALARSLERLYPETAFDMFGAGGDEMRAAGVDTLVDISDLAVIGVLEIARALPRFYSAYRKLIAEARRRRPAAVVLIDWPDFNMRLARRLRREGFRIIYYISPQVWAWRRGRVRALRRDVNRMLVILPFEEEFYKNTGVPVQYVGHPLVNRVHVTCTREEFALRHTLDAARPIVALLPGSRRKEIHYHLPAMLDAARRIADYPIADLETEEGSQSENQNPKSAIPQSAIRNPQFVIPLASTVDRGRVEAILTQAQDRESLDVRLVERDTYNALGHAEIAVVASGTATVEAALAGTPMVIVYRASELNWRLIRPLIHLDTFGMVNLIAGRQIVPELIQHDVTGERIAREVASIVSDPARLDEMRADLAIVRERLSAGGDRAPDRAARAVMDVIGLKLLD